MITLDVALQPKGYQLPVQNWGLHTTRGCGCLLFYEYPFLNEKLITYREDLLRNVTTYSVGELYLESEADDSKKWIMGQIQRKRGLSKRFQNQGIPVWVDLTIRNDCDNLAFFGVPQGWHCYSIRKPLAKDLLRRADMAQERANGEDLLMVVYGGSEVVREICQEKGWLFVPEYLKPQRFLPVKDNPLRKDLVTMGNCPGGKPQVITIMT